MQFVCENDVQKRGKIKPKRLDVSKLKRPVEQSENLAKMTNKLKKTPVNVTVDAFWNKLRVAIYESAAS